MSKSKRKRKKREKEIEEDEEEEGITIDESANKNNNEENKSMNEEISMTQIGNNFKIKVRRKALDDKSEDNKVITNIASPTTETTTVDEKKQLPFKNPDYKRDKKRPRNNLKQILKSEKYSLLPSDVPTYQNIAAPPSNYPTKKYCDITGLEATYTDPETKLRYCSAYIYKCIRTFNDEVIQQHLSIRKANNIIK